MPRTPSPSKVVAIRLPLPVYEHWQRAAAKKDRTVGAHLRSKLIEAAGLDPECKVVKK